MKSRSGPPPESAGRRRGLGLAAGGLLRGAVGRFGSVRAVTAIGAVGAVSASNAVSTASAARAAGVPGDPADGSADNAAPAAPCFACLAMAPSDWSRGYRLPDLDGRYRTPADFQGRATMLFFGFLACPAICPSTMYELARIREATGNLRDRVQILFATLDPQRDEPGVIRQWLDAFDPQAIGLRGSPADIAAATAGLQLRWETIAGRQPGSYTIDHGVQAYVFDPQGRFRLLYRPGPTFDDVAQDLRLLLGQPGG